MLEIIDISKRFGALQVLDKVSMRLQKGEKRVLLGANGAGKTSLFNVLSGQLTADSGRALLNGRELTRLPRAQRVRQGLARSFQHAHLFPGLRVREQLLLAANAAQGALKSVLTDPFCDRIQQDFIRDISERMALESHLDSSTEHLAYSACRQLEVALALACRPCLLLLDEPTAGIDPGETARFHQLIKNLPADLACLIIEHDMDLALALADSVSLLHQGRILFEGSPQQARASQQVQDIYLGRPDATA